MNVVRTYAGPRPSGPAANIDKGSDHSGAAKLESTDAYKARIWQLFQAGKFQELDLEAHDVRLKKERVQGGVWRLLLFYEAITKDDSPNPDWVTRRAKISEWITARPESATARIALANLFNNLAWAARGSGYSNTVSQAGWNMFAQRIQMAKKALLDAAQLKEKCPYWYEVAQNISVAEARDKAEAREVLDHAAAFEPTYYHFYREYANFLLPKWYGEEGETQAFAEEIAKRLPEPDASITYFEIASLLACQCDKERDSLEGMSWARVKDGYLALQRKYGVSEVKVNRFAYMAYVAGDKEAAQQAFAQIPNFVGSVHVWQSAESFESVKAWSNAP